MTGKSTGKERIWNAFTQHEIKTIRTISVELEKNWLGYQGIPKQVIDN